MKRLACVVTPFVSAVLAVVAIACTRPVTPTPFNQHEPLSEARYNEMQTRLGDYAAAGNEDGLRLLAAQLDAQLKLEEYLLKFREADHATLSVWTPLFASGVVSVVTTLLTLSLRK